MVVEICVRCIKVEVFQRGNTWTCMSVGGVNIALGLTAWKLYATFLRVIPGHDSKKSMYVNAWPPAPLSHPLFRTRIYKGTINCDCVPALVRTDVWGNEVIGLQLAQHWQDWGNASDMNHGGVAIKDPLMRRRVSGRWATDLCRKNTASHPPVRGQKAFVFSGCLVAMVTAQTAYWEKCHIEKKGLSDITFLKGKTQVGTLQWVLNIGMFCLSGNKKSDQFGLIMLEMKQRQNGFYELLSKSKKKQVKVRFRKENFSHFFGL